MKKVLCLFLLAATPSMAQELRPVQSTFSNAVGTVTNYKPVVKESKCVSNSKFKRNDREDAFITIYEWDAVKDGDKIRCQNGIFKNYNSKTKEQIFEGKNGNVVIIKGKAFTER